MPARLLPWCLLLRSSWLTVEGDRHVGRRRRAASPGRTGSLRRVGRRGWWRSIAELAEPSVTPPRGCSSWAIAAVTAMALIACSGALPRLVAATHRPRQPSQPADHRLDRARVEPLTRQLAGHHVQRRRVGRARVDIHRRPMSSFQSRPDLLRMGSAGAALRPVKPPQNATEVRPSTPTRIILHRV